MSAKGMLATVLATQLAKAITEDAGFSQDLPAGVYGPNLRAWLVMVADVVNEASVRRAWPLGICPDMDGHAARAGLAHWSATRAKSNENWIRRDGVVHRCRWNVSGGYPGELRAVDSEQPMRDWVFGTAPAPVVVTIAAAGITIPNPADEVGVWSPITTAPKDNKRPLYLARIVDGVLKELTFGGGWEFWQESHELSHINGWAWVSDGGMEEPTHWAYQDAGPPPVLADL